MPTESVRAEREPFPLKVRRFQILLENLVEERPLPCDCRWASYEEQKTDFELANGIVFPQSPTVQKCQQSFILAKNMEAKMQVIMEMFFAWKDPCWNPIPQADHFARPVLRRDLLRFMIQSYKVGRCFLHCFQRDHCCPNGIEHGCPEIYEKYVGATIEKWLVGSTKGSAHRSSDQHARFQRIQPWHQAAFQHYLEATRSFIRMETGATHIELTKEERRYEEVCAKYSPQVLRQVIYNFEVYHGMERGTVSFQQVVAQSGTDGCGLDIYGSLSVQEALYNYEVFYKLPHGTATLAQLKSSSAGLKGWGGFGTGHRRGQQHRKVSSPIEKKQEEVQKSSTTKEEAPRPRSDEEESRLLRLALLESVGACPAASSKCDEQEALSDDERNDDEDDAYSYEYSSAGSDELDEEDDEEVRESTLAEDSSQTSKLLGNKNTFDTAAVDSAQASCDCDLVAAAATTSTDTVYTASVTSYHDNNKEGYGNIVIERVPKFSSSRMMRKPASGGGTGSSREVNSHDARCGGCFFVGGYMADDHEYVGAFYVTTVADRDSPIGQSQNPPLQQQPSDDYSTGTVVPWERPQTVRPPYQEPLAPLPHQEGMVRKASISSSSTRKLASSIYEYNVLSHEEFILDIGTNPDNLDTKEKKDKVPPETRRGQMCRLLCCCCCGRMNNDKADTGSIDSTSTTKEDDDETLDL